MRVDQAYRAIDWTTVILVGAMMPLSTAMVQSGAAAMLADGLVKLVGDAGPMALLAGCSWSRPSSASSSTTQRPRHHDPVATATDRRQGL